MRHGHEKYAPGPDFEFAEIIEVDGVQRSIRDVTGRFLASDIDGQIAFWRWYGDGPVDELGRPPVLYRGLRGPAADSKAITAQKDYAVFATSSPYVANTYANIHPVTPQAHEVGAVYPLYAQVDRVFEFPVRGGRFDMFEFDRQASALKPGEALVARSVYDSGPQAFRMLDPEERCYAPADTWAFGGGTSFKSALGNPGTFCSSDPELTDGCSFENPQMLNDVSDLSHGDFYSKAPTRKRPRP